MSKLFLNVRADEKPLEDQSEAAADTPTAHRATATEAAAEVAETTQAAAEAAAGEVALALVEASLAAAVAPAADEIVRFVVARGEGGIGLGLDEDFRVTELRPGSAAEVSRGRYVVGGRGTRRWRVVVSGHRHSVSSSM